MTSTPPAGKPELDQRLFEHLAGQMRQRWQEGERPLADELLDEHPHLWEHPDLAVDLLCAEIQLRHQVAETVDHQQPPVETIPVGHLGGFPSTGSPRFPDVGERIGEFVVTGELGKGAAGRVVVATQSSLGDRPVVLKLMASDEREHLCLARLQHTSIVPLYASGMDPERRVRWLCMPYFGGASLWAVLQQLGDIPPARRTGRDLIEALERCGSPVPASPTSGRPVCDLISRLSYVQAICYLGACLADALSYAHSRGLVHLDVKPSNVLLAGDGQPMLLDFHLARAPLPGGTFVDGMGGTMNYMPPEQYEGMVAIAEGLPIPTAIDERADVYALGVLLHEALGGPTPYRPGQSPRLDRVNPQVSVSLTDLVARALSPDPVRRHARAADLAEDLRRHLRDLPLLSVPNRSLAERWARWRRRHPAALRHQLMLGAMMLFTFAFVGLLASDGLKRHEEAGIALREGREQIQRGRIGEALGTLERGRERVGNLPWGSDLARQIDQETTRARGLRDQQRQQQLTGQLHLLAEKLRGLGGSRERGKTSEDLVARCREFWLRREAIARQVDLKGDERAASDFLDVMLTWLDLRARPSPETDAEVLDELEKRLGPGAVLTERRRRLGTSDRSRELEPRAAWEFCTLARSALARGDVALAQRHLDQARKRAPRDRWTVFLVGECAFRQGRHQEALVAFSQCIGADPDNAAHYYNRSLARVSLGQHEQALDDLDAALRLDGTFALAWLERGLVRLERNELDLAERDLRQALAAGCPQARVNRHLDRLARSRERAVTLHPTGSTPAAPALPAPR